MIIPRQALQGEKSGQRPATDDPRPAYRQGLPEGDRSSSPAGCREQSGIAALQSPHGLGALVPCTALLQNSTLTCGAADGGVDLTASFTRFV